MKTRTAMALTILCCACQSTMKDGSGLGAAIASCALPLDPGTCSGTARMFRHNAATHSCDLFTYSGCGGNENNFATLEACESACGVTPKSTACQIDATDPSLPGVHVHLEADRCRVLSGTRQVFRYRIVLDNAISYTIPDSGGSCGRCSGYTTDPNSLVDTSVGDGRLAKYCRCDVGCCPPTTAEPVALSLGTVYGEIDWPGYQWRGPSDTGNAIGPKFPAGDAFAEVTFKVPGVGSVDAKLPIVVFSDDVGPAKIACGDNSYVYPSGSVGVPGPNCSTCQCDNGQLAACIKQECNGPCPGGTTFGAECLRCGPTDVCEVVRHDCLPTCTPTGNECAVGGLGAICVDGVCKMVCG